MRNHDIVPLNYFLKRHLLSNIKTTRIRIFQYQLYKLLQPHYATS